MLVSAAGGHQRIGSEHPGRGLDSALVQTLSSIPGFGDTSAAELAGETGTVARFELEAGLALYIGIAILDNSSGKMSGARAPRQANTRAKAAMMVAIARHVAHVASSKICYDKKRTQVKKHNQAIRALGRQMVHVIWALVKSGRKDEDRSKIA